jgi:hypothetical protein
MELRGQSPRELRAFRELLTAHGNNRVVEYSYYLL